MTAEAVAAKYEPVPMDKAADFAGQLFVTADAAPTVPDTDGDGYVEYTYNDATG